MATFADSPYSVIDKLAARVDDASTHALVDWFEHADPDVRLEAARALASRELPSALRPRLIGALFDGRHVHPDSLVRWPLRVAARGLFEGRPPRRSGLLRRCSTPPRSPAHRGECVRP